MPDYEIKAADFEKQKKWLRRFSEQPATSAQLDKFSTGGQWTDFWSGGVPGVLSGHKVTGDEMNAFVTDLQNCFVEINERERKVIKEFGQVYETFEALDKGYIQGILISVKSAEKASQEAKDAQKDIDDTIKALGKTVDKLKEFRKQIDDYDHLDDIDEIWEDVDRVKSALVELSKKLNQQISEVSKRLEHVELFINEIEKQKHIADIDSMWNRIDEIKNDLMDEFSERISGAESSVKTHEGKYKALEANDANLRRRLYIAYIIAGGAFGISVIEILLQLIGVL